MKYESNILKRLIDTYGVVGNPRYISEIIKEFIVQGKERFPDLFTYQADWLAHIDEFGLNPSYFVSYTGQSIYAPNTLERPVKSAILKGNTLVNIVNNDNWVQGTGNNTSLFTQNISIKKGQTYTVIGKMESSDTFEGTAEAPAFRIRTGTNNSGASLLFIQQSDVVFKQTFTNNNNNDTIHLRFFNQKTNYKKLMIIEGDYTNVDISYFEGMQSVKMPVLTTTGKNLFNEKYQNLSDFTYDEDGIQLTTNKRLVFQNPVKIQANKTYIGLIEYSGECTSRGIGFNDVNQNGVYPTYRFDPISGSEVKVKQIKFTPTSDTYLVSIHNGFDHEGVLSPKIHKVAIFESSNINESYEPYKTNILTVNEDVTLRSNGSVYDELDLLTGKLTQRIDEDGSVLTQEVVKTVDLSILDQNGQNVKQLMSFSGGTHFNTGSLEGSLIPSVSVTVETDLEETLKVCSLEGNTM